MLSTCIVTIVLAARLHCTSKHPALLTTSTKHERFTGMHSRVTLVRDLHALCKCNRVHAAARANLMNMHVHKTFTHFLSTLLSFAGTLLSIFSPLRCCCTGWTWTSGSCCSRQLPLAQRGQHFQASSQQDLLDPSSAVCSGAASLCFARYCRRHCQAPPPTCDRKEPNHQGSTRLEPS